MSHVFYATRKGTPIGERGTWARECDVCGLGPGAPVHEGCDQAEHDMALLRALNDTSTEKIDDFAVAPGPAGPPRVGSPGTISPEERMSERQAGIDQGQQ